MSFTSPIDGLAAVALALAVILSAIVSLITSSVRRETIRNGEATAQALCELTGILDPKELQDIFGPPDMGRVWRRVTLPQVMQARQPLGHIISGQSTDIACITVAVLSFLLDNIFVGLGLTLAVSIQAVGWIVSTRLPK
ncbi:MAG: hypothetical protein AAF292_01635 [Pseudomonadota bacterium]